MACADVPVELGNMSPHLAEAMLVVEDMPILKRINVMVGITRSKLILVFGLVSHCRKTNNELENKKPKNQETPQKNKTHTPRGGVVAESWVLSFFFVFFCFFVFGFWFCLAIAEKPNRYYRIVNGCKAVREPWHMCSVSGSRIQ